ncbi:MAG TPA: TonB-dependent receptor [Gammaproteobacteria bacterium]|nr:TonB-dependent receptor [Gammaproteobacteria bacterium]
MYGHFREFLSKTLLVSLTSAFALMTFAAAAQAQDEAGTQNSSADEELVVTGYRGSLEQSLNLKRDTVGAVDSIMAEDIAKFPDNNLAESLQRIPGVVIDRAAGEGRNVSVRGLSPEFTRTLINGMETMASSGFTDALNGATRGRGFDFNTFDSDLFRSLTVRKTSNAQTEEGSLGATIQLQTARPFDFDDTTLVVSGQMGYNDLSEESDPKAAVLASTTFADGTFGILGSVSYSERTLVEKGASSVRWAGPTTTTATTAVQPFGTYQGAAAPQLLNLAFKPRLPRYDYYQHDIERTGANVSLQYKPMDSLEVSLDLLYSKHDASREERFAQGVLNNAGINTGTNVVDFEVSNPDIIDPNLMRTNSLLFAELENGRIASESRRDEMTTEFNQHTLSIDYDITNSLRVNALVGKAESDFDNPVQTSLNLQRDGADWSFDYRGGRRVPIFDFGPDMQDLSGWSVSSIRLRPITVDNTFDLTQLNVEFDINDSLTLKAGVGDKKYEFETTQYQRNPEDAFIVGTVDPSVMQIIDGGNGTWATVDFDAFIDFYDINALNEIDETAGTPNIKLRMQDTWGVTEDTSSAYLQLDFEGSLGTVPVRGNIGVRKIETDQNSVAFGTIGASPEEVRGSHSYSDNLPSMELVFETSEEVLIRLGISEVLARAPLTNLRPNVTVSVAGGNRTIAGGNPALEPTKATAYDLAMEYYFAEESLFSMAVFSKDIKTQVQTIGGTMPFTETGLPISVAEAACNSGPDGYGSNCNENMLWNTSTPVNGPGGDLFGFEVSYQQPFTFLPSFWSNFGIYTNYTYVKSQLDYVNSAGLITSTHDLQNLSQNAYNITLYYEEEKFSGRVATTYRESFLTNVPGRDGNDLEGTNPTNNVDASFSYKLADDLELTFEALNLTNEAIDQWVDQTANRPSFYHESGKQYYFGARYSFY